MSHPPPKITVALAQLNPLVGDLKGNGALLLETCAKAGKAGADLVLFPELFITGYPPEDLVRKPAFQQEARATVEALAVELGDGPAALVGTIWPEGGKLFNAVVLLDHGRVAAIRFKVE